MLNVVICCCLKPVLWYFITGLGYLKIICNKITTINIFEKVFKQRSEKSTFKIRKILACFKKICITFFHETFKTFIGWQVLYSLVQCCLQQDILAFEVRTKRGGNALPLWTVNHPHSQPINWSGKRSWNWHRQINKSAIKKFADRRAHTCARGTDTSNNKDQQGCGRSAKLQQKALREATRERT